MTPLLALAALSLSLGSASDAPPAAPWTPPPVALVATSEAGMETAWWGWGPDYDVVFAEDGPRFAPRSEGELAVDFRLRSIARGNDVLVAPDGVRAPRADAEALEVSYPVGDLGREVYRLRADGLKQDFVLDRVPRGSGDLVVRLSALAGAPLAWERDGEGARLVDAEGHGVALGRVVGVDGAGRTCIGTVRDAGAHGATRDVELVLPGDFVDRAVPPLVVDPLLSAHHGYSSWPIDGDSVAPDATYLDLFGVYAVVWERRSAHFGSLVLGATVDSAGRQLNTKVQGFRKVPAPYVLSSSPTVSRVGEGGEAFLVWGEAIEGDPSGVIEARHLVLNPGSWKFDVVGTTSKFVAPPASNLDAGGGPNAKRALVAWDAEGKEVWCSMLESGGDGLSFGAAQQVDAGFLRDGLAPSVSEGPRWAIAWESRVGTSSILARRWEDGELLEPAWVGTSYELDERSPCLSGGGILKTLAYVRKGEVGREIVTQELLAGFGSCMDLCPNGSPFVVAVLPEWPAVSGPAVARMEDGTDVVCWATSWEGLWECVGTTLASAEGPVCEPPFHIAETLGRPSLHLAEDPAPDLAFLFWEGKIQGLGERETRGARIAPCGH